MAHTDKDQLLPLKITVISLGVVLVGGVIWLCAMLYHGLPSSSSGQRSAAEMSGCKGGNLELPLAEMVDSIMKDGPILTLVTKSDGDQQTVMIVDYCANRVISTISLRASSARKNQNALPATPPAAPPAPEAAPVLSPSKPRK